MKDQLRLNEKQLTELAYAIGKPVFKFLNKRIEKELTKVPDYQKINVNDFVNIVILILVNIDSNKLVWLRNYYKSKTNTEMDFVALLSSYIQNLSTLMTEDEAKRLKEKMN